MLLYFIVLIIFYIDYTYWLSYVGYFDYDTLIKRHRNDHKELNNIYFNIYMFVYINFILSLLCIFFDIIFETLLYILITIIVGLYIVTCFMCDHKIDNLIFNTQEQKKDYIIKFNYIKKINNFLQLLIITLYLVIFHYNNTLNSIVYVIFTFLIHMIFLVLNRIIL
jgi:hypothetical protein